MDTLALDRTVWDLVLDTAGNWALASNPYAIAQDVASAIRLFKGELWYDTAKGIPYFDQVLGQQPPLQLMKTYFINAALTVPQTRSAICYISSFGHDRAIVGQVQVKTVDGAVVVASAPNVPNPLPFVLDVSTLGGPDVLG